MLGEDYHVVIPKVLYDKCFIPYMNEYVWNMLCYLFVMCFPIGRVCR